MNKLILLFTSILSFNICVAQTSYTWNGTTSTNWSTNTNWTPNGIPGASDNVTIVTGSNPCILNTNKSINNLTITSGVINLNAFILNTAGIVLCNGGNCNNGTFNSTATNLTFAGTTFGANITANVTEVYFNGSTFNGSLTVSKNGSMNAQSTGNNVFNGVTSITNAGTGYLLMTNGALGRNETFNNTTTLNTTNTGALYIGYARNVALNANITVNNSASTGNIQIGRVGSVNLNTGVTITCGTFSGAALNLYNIIQTGAKSQILAPGNLGAINIFGSSFNGALTVNAGMISAQSSNFAATVNYSLTGTNSSNWSAGGNVYNGVLTVNNSNNGFIGFANGTADTYNDDVYAYNTSTNGGRIIFGNNSSSQFNGNIYVAQSGNTSAGGIALGYGGTFPIINIAATKSIITSGTFDSGYLQLYRIQQADATPITINTSGTTNVILNNNVFTGSLAVTAPDITPFGGTYNQPVTFNKTGGASNHNNGNLNIFNSTCTINQTSNTGYFMLGYNCNDIFNDDITITSSGNGGIYLGYSSGTGFPTLASGKTVMVGTAGFSAGFLYFGNFTQLGSSPITLPLTGTATSLTFKSCTFGGNIVSVSSSIIFNGNTFNGSINATKTGATNDASPGGNTFNDLSEFVNSGSGYFIFGNGNPDVWNGDVTFTSSGSDRISPCWASAGNQFNGNITVNSAASSQGINFCSGNAISTATLAASKTIQIGALGYSSGYFILSRFTQLGSSPINLNLLPTSNYVIIGPNCNIGGNLTLAAPTINNIYNSIFNGALDVTKNGNGNDSWLGGNVFNSTSAFTNSSANYLLLGNGNPDTYIGDVTFTSSGSDRIRPCYSSTGNMFYGNISLNSIGSSTGIVFCESAASTATLTAGKTIGTVNFDTGYLILQRFTQLGSTPVSLNLTPTANYIQYGPSSTFGGDLTSISPNLNLNSTTFNGTSSFSITGLANQYCFGGNTFNGVSTITHNGTGYFLLGNALPDTWNSDVTFNNNSNDRILPAWGSIGNLFNGNIYVNTTGSATGIQFCGGNATATATLAATKSVFAGSSGLNSGYLILKQFTQLGSAPITLTLSPTASFLQFGPLSSLGGNVTAVSPRLFFNGCSFSGTTNCTKNGGFDDGSIGNNIFNGATIINNNSTGHLMFGNGNSDQFNASATFNNFGSNHIYVAYNSSNNIFGGLTTFNNAPASTNAYIYISNANVNTAIFNDNIVVTNINGAGVFFGNGVGTTTLSAGKTITIGAGGFNSGRLVMRNFTQLGSTPQSFTTTGTNIIEYGPSAVFGGNVTSVSPRLYFNGCTFNGSTNCIKNGAIDDDSNGSNTFTGPSTITNYGSGRILLGNGSTDVFMNTTTFNNLGSANMFVAHNSPNNVFAGVTTFNNSPTSTAAIIYVSGYSTGTLFNDNIIVNNVNGNGVRFCYGNSTATSTLAVGKTVAIGVGGFNSGILLLKQFTQLGSTAQSFITTGTSSTIQYGPLSSFGGNVSSTSPRINFNGCTFNGTSNFTKTGASNDDSNGANVFTGNSTVTNSGAGYLLFGNVNSDVFMSDVTINNIGSSSVYLAHNSNGNIFNGNLYLNNKPLTTGAIYLNYHNHTTNYNGDIEVVSTSGIGVRFGEGTGSSVLAIGKKITIGVGGFSTGTLLLKQFTQLGFTPQALNITSGNALLQLGPSSQFDGNVNFNFPQVLLNGTTYNGSATIQKNGATDNAGIGGNTFNGTTIINNTGSGHLMTGNGTSDAFNGITTFNNTGTYRIYLANNHAGQTTTFAQATTFNANKSGGSDPWSYLIGEYAGSNLRFDDDLTVNILGNIRSDYRILTGAGTSAIYNGNVTVNLSNTNSSTQISMGTVGTSNYNGNIIVSNTGAGTTGGVFFNTSVSATSILATTKTISLGASGFTGGTLSLARFTQLGATPQTLSQMSGTGILISGPSSTFNGDVDFNFPQIYLNGSTYNGLATVQKNGVTDNASLGNNIFNSVTNITNSSPNYLRLANTSPDNYYGDVTFTQNNSGVLAPNYNSNCTYSRDVTISSTGTYSITFGSAANGIATFDGGNAQNINKSGSVGNPIFTRLVASKTANDITLNTRINISSSLTLTQGVFNTTAANILNMNNGSATTIGNATSYISGPMNYDMSLNGVRTLNFPIGKSTDWRPATLVAAHNNATSYTYNAELTNASANALGWTKPASINLTSLVHYWDINRSVTATGVASPTTHVAGTQAITLYYGNNDGVTDPTFLTVVKNTSAAPTTWFDIGGTGATAGSGSVKSSSSPTPFTSYSRFTLANRLAGTNPLPIELLYFTVNPIQKAASLDWATASESNNDHFEIERSIDGINFEYITSIKAHGDGNSVTKQIYNTVDAKPYKGVSYYRLKQVDKNTKFKYAPIVSIEFVLESYVNLFPNPASNLITIKASDDYNNASIKIISNFGVEVLTNTRLHDYNGTIDLSNLASGIYYAIIQNGEITENIKICILK